MSDIFEPIPGTRGCPVTARGDDVHYGISGVAIPLEDESQTTEIFLSQARLTTEHLAPACLCYFVYLSELKGRKKGEGVVITNITGQQVPHA